MPSYSVVEAKDKLSSLIARAEAGEEVVITRHGKPTVELRLVRPETKDSADVQAAHARLKEQREKLPFMSISADQVLRLENDDAEH